MIDSSGNSDDGIEAITPSLVSLFNQIEVPGNRDIEELVHQHNVENPDLAVTVEQLETIIRRLRRLQEKNIFPAWIPERYEYQREIGRGATAHVYLAFDRQDERDVAIKIINPGESLPRFERESKLLQQLESPHIVRQLAFYKGKGSLHTKAAIVMEFIAGTYLSDVISANKDTPHRMDEGITWMLHVCEAMITASDQGIIHRDIKPANLIVAQQDSSIKLLDFGIATTITGSGKIGAPSRLTRTGEVLGTPHYMSPEQSTEPTVVDIRNDIYSYGATFYHLLTGSTPFSGKDWIDVVSNHRHQILESPLARNPDIPTSIVNIIETCMAKRARDRFSSFQQIKDDLRAAGFGVLDVEPLPPTSPLTAETEHKVMTAAPLEIPLYEHSITKESAASPAEQARLDEPLYDIAAEGDRPSILASMAPPIEPVSVQFWGIDGEHFFENNRELHILTGDILEAANRCEVLVSSDDSQLSMLGGVALRIKQAAGNDYFDRTRHLAPVMPGRVVTSAAGQLPYRFIFHAITIPLPIGDTQRNPVEGEPEKQQIVPTPDLIRGILDDCFHHAQSLGISSIAFPLLGTGNAGMDPAICLQTMVEYISRELALGLTPLQRIRIIFLSP